MVYLWYIYGIFMVCTVKIWNYYGILLMFHVKHWKTNTPDFSTHIKRVLHSHRLSANNSCLNKLLTFWRTVNGGRSGFEHMFGCGMGRNALHSFTAKISLKHHESHQKKIPQSTLHQRIIPRKFRDGKTHNSYTKICFSKFNFTKLFVYNPAKSTKSRENSKFAKNW